MALRPRQIRFRNKICEHPNRLWLDRLRVMFLTPRVDPDLFSGSLSLLRVTGIQNAPVSFVVLMEPIVIIPIGWIAVLAGLPNLNIHLSLLSHSRPKEAASA